MPPVRLPLDGRRAASDRPPSPRALPAGIGLARGMADCLFMRAACSREQRGRDRGTWGERLRRVRHR